MNPHEFPDAERSAFSQRLTARVQLALGLALDRLSPAQRLDRDQWSQDHGVGLQMLRVRDGVQFYYGGLLLTSVSYDLLSGEDSAAAEFASLAAVPSDPRGLDA